MKTLTSQKGFTLIELMVVILIIAILGALGLVSYSQANRTARDGKRRADMEAIRQAMLLYRQEEGNYNLGTNVIGGLVSANYLSAPAPTDPQTATTPYITTSSNTEFCVCANVEGDRGNSNNSTCTSWNSTNTGGFYCAEEP